MRRRDRVSYRHVAIRHGGQRLDLPVRAVRVPARLNEPDWSVWTEHQIVYAPRLSPSAMTRAARSIGLSAALSWLVSNSAMLAEGPS